MHIMYKDYLEKYYYHGNKIFVCIDDLEVWNIIKKRDRLYNSRLLCAKIKWFKSFKKTAR